MLLEFVHERYCCQFEMYQSFENDKKREEERGVRCEGVPGCDRRSGGPYPAGRASSHHGHAHATAAACLEVPPSAAAQLLL